MKTNLKDYIKNLIELMGYTASSIVTSDKLSAIIQKSSVKKARFRWSLKETAITLETMIKILRDHSCKKNQVDNFTLVSFVCACLYFLNPYDLIPDFLAFGLLDDIQVINLVGLYFAKMINNYSSSDNGLDEIYEMSKNNSTGRKKRSVSKMKKTNNTKKVKLKSIDITFDAEQTDTKKQTKSPKTKLTVKKTKTPIAKEAHKSSRPKLKVVTEEPDIKTKKQRAKKPDNTKSSSKITKAKTKDQVKSAQKPLKATKSKKSKSTAKKTKKQIGWYQKKNPKKSLSESKSQDSDAKKKINDENKK